MVEETNSLPHHPRLVPVASSHRLWCLPCRLGRWRALTPRKGSSALPPVRAAPTSHRSLADAAAGDARLGYADLKRAAAFARLSGLCYLPRARVGHALSDLHGTLVAAGSTPHTSWIVADCDVPVPPEGGASVSSRIPHRCERVVLFRGASWNAEQVDAWALWRRLGDFWPADFLPDRTQPRGALVAHRGIAGILDEVWPSVAPHLTSVAREAEEEGTSAEGDRPMGAVSFAGHSLGGSLALLAAARMQLDLMRRTGALPWVYQFGAPPALAHKDGGGALPAAAAAGLDPHCTLSFVLDNDLVPRAFLHVDPGAAPTTACITEVICEAMFQRVDQTRFHCRLPAVYRALLSRAPTSVSQLMRLREYLWGPNVPLSSRRFLFECTGQSLLLRWDERLGYRVQRVHEEQVGNMLQIEVKEGVEGVWQLVRSILVRKVHGRCTRWAQGVPGTQAACSK